MTVDKTWFKNVVTNMLEFVRACASTLASEVRVFGTTLLDVVHIIQERKDKDRVRVLASQIKEKLFRCWRFCILLLVVIVVVVWPTSNNEVHASHGGSLESEKVVVSLSPSARAEKLAFNYSEMQCNLLQVLHSGSGKKPEENVPYWISANNFVKFTGCDAFEVFTCKNDPHDIYYDFCVETSRHYVDDERLQGGFYIYVGDREYKTVHGSTRRLYCFRELDKATSDELNKIIARRRSEARARNKKSIEEAKENARKRVKAVEDFIDEYVGEKFWEAPKQQSQYHVVKMKKKFRYCDMAQLNCTYGGVNKITGIRLFGVLDSEYEYEALKKECAAMLKVLDEKFGVRGGSWETSRSVQDVYSYAAEPWLDSHQLLGDKVPKKQCICVKFERKGMPPRDGVRKELPPL